MIELLIPALWLACLFPELVSAVGDFFFGWVLHCSFLERAQPRHKAEKLKRPPTEAISVFGITLQGAEVCTGPELAAATYGFLAASTDEAERAKAAITMNDTNLVIISSPKKQ
jgi:hypothetical protein